MNSPESTDPLDQGRPPENRQYRPYRSKRSRPCDTCRRRKVACRIDSQPPCENCTSSGIECCFEEPPLKRRREAAQVAMPVTDRDSFVVADDPAVAPWVDTGITLDPEDLIQDNSGWRDWALEGSVNDLINVSSSQIPAWSNVGHRSVFDMPPVSDGMLLQDLGGTEFLNAYSDPVHHSPNSGLPAPSVRSLDKLDGFSSQYFGLSGESDPYLLRHFRFLSDGQTQFFKVHFRSLAAQSESENSTRPPVQFMVSSDELGNAMKSETTFGDSPRSGSARQALDDIVGPEDGRRLVGL